MQCRKHQNYIQIPIVVTYWYKYYITINQKRSGWKNTSALCVLSSTTILNEIYINDTEYILLFCSALIRFSSVLVFFFFTLSTMHPSRPAVVRKSGRLVRSWGTTTRRLSQRNRRRAMDDVIIETQHTFTSFSSLVPAGDTFRPTWRRQRCLQSVCRDRVLRVRVNRRRGHCVPPPSAGGRWTG